MPPFATPGPENRPRDPLRPGRRVRVTLITPGILLAAAAVALAFLYPVRHPAADPAESSPRHYRPEGPGARAGTIGLRLGSRVFSLKHPELGTGTVTDLRYPARVDFDSGEVALDLKELRLYIPEDEPAEKPAGRVTAPGSADRTPVSIDDGLEPGNFLRHYVVCPGRPQLGHGIVREVTTVYTVNYPSGTRVQTDQEVRHAAPPQGPVAGESR